MREFRINQYRRDHNQTTLLAIVELEKQYREFDPRGDAPQSSRSFTPSMAHHVREVNGIHTDRSYLLDLFEVGASEAFNRQQRGSVRKIFQAAVEEGITDVGQLQDAETLELTRLRQIDVGSAVFLKKATQAEDLQSEAEHDVKIIIDNTDPGTSNRESAIRARIAMAHAPYIAFEFSGHEEESERILTPQLARDIRKRKQFERYAPYTEIDDLLIGGTDWDSQQIRQVNTVFRTVQRNGMETLRDIQHAPHEWGVTVRKLGPEAVAFVDFTLRYNQTMAMAMGKTA